MQFGEIIEPSSRALWDHDSDGFTELSLSGVCDVPEQIKKFVIFEGKIAVDFANNCIIVGSSAVSINGANISLYHLPGGLVVCTCLGHIEGLGGKVAALLEPWLMKAEQVMAIQTAPRITYLGEHPDEPFLLRSLYTSNAKNRYGLILEQPNILSGVTAGVMSFCEHFDVPGSAWCLYTSPAPYGTDSTATEPINELIKYLEIAVFKSFQYKPGVSSNLYM